MFSIPKRMLQHFGLFVLLLMVVTACAPAAPAATTGDGSATTNTGSTAVESATTSAAPDELITVRPEEPPSLDWKDLTHEPQIWALYAVIEALTDRDARTQEVRPSLAESWTWDEANTWTFTLRQGVTFHNGEPFNADAVIYTFERIADPAENAQLAQHLQNLESITALDDYTVEIKTVSIDPIFDRRISALRIGPPQFSRENPDQLSTTIIGTGPYKFVEWVKGQHIKLTANTEYWGEQPSIPNVTILVRQDPSVRAAMVQTGEAHLGWAINPEDVAQTERVVQYTDLRTIAMRVDTTGQNPALADVRVRQAMLYAIDLETVANTIFLDIAAPAKGNQQVAPAVLGYDPDMDVWPYDPERARQLIDEAAADGVLVDTPITIVQRVGQVPRDNELVEYAINAWNEIGLNVNVEVLEAAAWVEVLFAVGEEQEHGDLMFMLHSVELQDYSHSSDRFLDSDANISLWHDEETARLLAVASELRDEERRAAYQEVAHYLEDKVPFFVFGSMVQTHAVSPNLQWEPRPDSIGNFWEMSFVD